MYNVEVDDCCKRRVKTSSFKTGETVSRMSGDDQKQFGPSYVAQVGFQGHTKRAEIPSVTL